MDETSRLIVAVDSTSVPKAQAELDAYTASAAKADAATGKLAQTSRASNTAHAATTAEVSRAEQAVNAFGETQAQVDARLRSVAQAAVAEREAMAKQASAMAQATSISAAYSEATKRLVAQQNAQMSAWTKSRAPVVELEALLSKNTLTTAEVAKANALLDKAQASGVISAGELTAAFKALDEAKIKDIAVTKAQDAANKSAINSRTQYELGVLGGEIATGNTSRIKRSVPALLNASGLTTKLLSPVGLGITAAVASLALFGKAVVDREQDLLNFNKALAATGDFAGTSAAQLQGIAAMVGDSTHDYGNATKAVLALAQSGQVLGSQMQQMATIAVNMAYITGQSVEDVAKQLIDLQGDPTQAVVKLTSAMGLLTSAQYNQIVITQQTKGANAAAALAMNDLAKASDDARVKLVENAGIVIRAWDGFKNGLSDIGRMIASIGAQQTAIQKLADIQRQINNQATPGEKAALSAHFAPQIATLQQQIRSDAMFAAGQELANQGKQAHDKALAEALASTKQGDEGFVAAAEQINKKRYAALVGIVDPSIRDRINAAYDQQIRDAVSRANSAYRGGSSGGAAHKSKADPLANFTGYVNNIVANSQGNQYDNTGIGKYVTSVEKLYNEFHKQVTAGADANKAIEQYDRAIQALGNDLAKTTAKQNAADAAYKAQLDQQLATRKNAIDLQVASVGMGQQEYQQYQELNQVYQEFDHQLAQLNKERDAGNISIDQYNTRLAELKQNESDTVAAVVDGYKRMNSAREDWMNGLTSSWQNYIDQGKDVAGMTANVFTDAFSGMENSMVNFVQTGKLSFKDLADSIISDLVRMETRILISKALSSILSAYATGPSGYNMGYFGTYSQSATDATAANSVDYIMGGRANGGPVAGGSLYEVAEGGKPEVLSSGGHTYLLMGAQDGYVTPASTSGTSPLSRANSAGIAQTKGSGTTVIVENHSDSQAQVQQSKDGNGNDLIRVIVGQAINGVNSEIARGGSTYKTLQQTFGLNRRGVPVAG